MSSRRSTISVRWNSGASARSSSWWRPARTISSAQSPNGWNDWRQALPSRLDRLFQILLHHGARSVDAQDFQPLGADIGEFVRHAAGDHRDIVRSHLERLLTRHDSRLAALDDPGFGIGMCVQPWPLAGIVVHGEERDGGAVIGALETDRPAFAGRPV